MSEPERKTKLALDEFGDLVQRLERTDDFTRFQHDVDRWKRRTIESLSSLIPAHDIAALDRISTAPDWDGDATDPFEAVIGEHRAFLHSLLQDIRKHPDSYGTAVVRKAIAPPPGIGSTAAATPPGTQPSTRAPLPVPERVTLAWLWHNVPARFWVGLLLLILGSIAIGMKLGLTPEIARIVAPLLGVDVGP